MFLRQSTVTTSRAATIMTISIIRSTSIIRSRWAPFVAEIWNLITLTGYQQIIWFDYGKIIYRTGIIMHFTTNHTSTHIIIYCPFFLNLTINMTDHTNYSHTTTLQYHTSNIGSSPTYHYSCSLLRNCSFSLSVHQLVSDSRCLESFSGFLSL